MVERSPQPAVTTRAVYYAARILAQAAQNLFLAALFVLAGTSTMAGVELTGVFIAILVPAIGLAAVGGALVDRIGPSRGYVLGAALRLASVVFALAFIADGHFVWLAAFAYSAASQVFTPAEMALVKTIEPRRPGRAHSLLVAMQYVGQGLGMLVLAPALYLWGGTAAMLAASAIGFGGLVALALVVMVLLAGSPTASQERRNAFQFGVVCRFFLSEGRASYALVVLAFRTLVSRAIVVALPFYIAHDLGMGGPALVFLVVPGIAGVAVGLAWCWRSLTLASADRAMRLSLAGMAVCVLALAAPGYGVTAVAQYSQLPPVARLEASLNTTFVVALPVAFALGLVLTSSLVAARVILTEIAPSTQQARVFALQEMVSESLLVLPLLCAGLGVQFGGARPTLAAIGGVALVALVVAEVVGPRRPRLRLAGNEFVPETALRAW